MELNPSELAHALLIAERVKLSLVTPIPVTAPAVGAEISVKVPNGALWEILSVRYRFVTSAVVATRTSVVVVKDQDGDILNAYGPGSTQAAGGTNDYVFWPGATDTFNGGFVYAQLPSPPQLVHYGWTISTQTANIDPGDAYSRIFLVIRDWLKAKIEAFAYYLTQ